MTNKILYVFTYDPISKGQILFRVCPPPDSNTYSLCISSQSESNLSFILSYAASSLSIVCSTFRFAALHVFLLDASSLSMSLSRAERFFFSSRNCSFASAFAFEPPSFIFASSCSILLSNSLSFSFDFLSNSFFSSENVSFVVDTSPDFPSTLVFPSSPCPQTFFTNPGKADTVRKHAQIKTGKNLFFFILSSRSFLLNFLCCTVPIISKKNVITSVRPLTEKTVFRYLTSTVPVIDLDK